MTRLRKLIIVLLLLPGIFLGWLTMSENGLKWAYQQAELYLPVELSFDKLEGRLIGPLTVTGFNYKQQGIDIHADQITVDWLPTALLAANINLSQLHVKSLDIALTDTEKTEQLPAGKQPLKLPDISLPWRLLLKNAEVDNLNLKQNDQQFHVDKIKLNATSLFSKINIKQLSINADAFMIDIKGKLQPVGDYRHDLNINWQLTLPSSEVIKGKGQLTGNMQTTRIQQTLSGPLKLTLDAKLNNLLNQLNWTAKTNINQFDITKFENSWPKLSGAAQVNAEGDLFTAKLTGKMQGKYPELGIVNAEFNLQRLADNSIQINNLQLQAPENNTQLNIDGLWTPGKNTGGNDGNIKLSLNWQNLRWPGRNTPWFNSANGSGTIDGNINRYQLTLHTDSPWPQAAPSSWHATATGDLDGMEINTLRINALNGEANIHGQLNWSPQLNWQAKGSINDVDPAARLPQWPGQLN